MSRRSDQRRAAVFALYQHELTSRPLDDLFEPGTASFSRALAHAASDHQPELDALIERHSTGWALERIAPLERAILRVALLEMLHPELVAGDRPIPPEGAISEAVDLAKEFCAAQAPGFVNGILGAALRSVRDNGRIVPDALEDLVDRLTRAAAELRGGDLAPERAAALVDECARLATDAGAELDRRVRAAESAGSAPAPGQLALGG